MASGQFKLNDEKKFLAEVSALRKQKKEFSSFGPQEEAIDGERKKAESMRKKLDEFEPENKRFKKELDDLYTQLREMNSKKVCTGDWCRVRFICSYCLSPATLLSRPHPNLAPPPATPPIAARCLSRTRTTAR